MKNPNRYFDNARLAIDLALSLGAKGTDSGTMSNFSRTPPDWHCPACRRTKAQIARLDKHSNFYCALHFHHDHLYEGIVESLGLNEFCVGEELASGIESLVRFAPSFVCMDCNMADSRAARSLSVPKHFSFSPAEIGMFVQPSAGSNHTIDIEAARTAFGKVVGKFTAALEQAEGILYAVCPTDLENALGSLITGRN